MNERRTKLDQMTDEHYDLFERSLERNIRENWGKNGVGYPKNKQVRWCPCDDEDLYKKNIKENFALMKELDFVSINNNFNYNFNEYGFRSDSFDNECTILFNGCSQTMGIGLPLQDIWPKQIANYYNVNYHNIAVGGTDFGHMAQRSVYWLYKLKPKYHIIKETPLARFNWWRDNLVQSTTSYVAKDSRLKQNLDIFDIAIDDDNIEWARYTSLKVIETVCNELDIKLLILPPGRLDFYNFTENGEKDWARDLVHYGRTEQNVCFKYVIEKEFIKI